MPSSASSRRPSSSVRRPPSRPPQIRPSRIRRRARRAATIRSARPPPPAPSRPSSRPLRLVIDAHGGGAAPASASPSPPARPPIRRRAPVRAVRACAARPSACGPSARFAVAAARPLLRPPVAAHPCRRRGSFCAAHRHAARHGTLLCPLQSSRPRFGSSPTHSSSRTGRGVSGCPPLLCHAALFCCIW